MATQEEMLSVLRQAREEERKYQTRRTMRFVFVIIPGVLVGLLALKAVLHLIS